VRPALLDGFAVAIDQAEAWLRAWQPGQSGQPGPSSPPTVDLMALLAQPDETDYDGEPLAAEFQRDAVERLQVVARWLEAGSAASEALREESMRAVHTLQGGARLLRLDARGQIFDTLERVVRRGGAQSFGDGQRERVQAVVGTLWRGLDDDRLLPETLETLAEQLREIEGALPAAEPAPDPQQLLDALARLRAAESQALSLEPTAADLPAAAHELQAFGDAMAGLAAPAMAEAARTLAARLEAVREPGAALLSVLPELFEALYRRLDRLREGFAEEDPAPLLDRIAGLPVAAPARRLPPPVLATPPAAPLRSDDELGAVFTPKPRHGSRRCGPPRPPGRSTARRWPRLAVDCTPCAAAHAWRVSKRSRNARRAWRRPSTPQPNPPPSGRSCGRGLRS
jgi:Hpt domain.